MDQIFDAFQVTEDIEGAKPTLPDYPLLKGDLIYLDKGVWWKFAPGMAIGYFYLTEEQVATLKPIKYTHDGMLNFKLVEDSDG